MICSRNGLRHHDGPSVAAALVDICSKWGVPEFVRCDNDTEFGESLDIGVV